MSVSSVRCAIATLAALAVSISGCWRNSYDVQCVAGDEGVQLSWTPEPQSDHYRVYRVVAGGEIEPVGEAQGPAWLDASVEGGAEYHYIVRPIGPDGLDFQGAGQCSVTAAGTSGPDPVGAPICRAKSGKVDLLWEPVANAVSYRVLRAPAASGFETLAQIASPPYADFAVTDGSSYEYAVVAIGADGAAAAQSPSCSATPGPNGGGDPPAPVADLTCRGKRDKVDLAWSAVADAALYRVFRTVGGATTELGEVVHPVFVDFGVTPSAAHDYVVRAVAADGTESADSAVCSYAATDRDGGNRAPAITSEPVTNALEKHVYRYDIAATDPEGQPIAFSIVQAPPGMFLEEETNTLTWIPVQAQVGPHAIELRATDSQGAFGSQAFVVEAADFNDPPRITSLPNLRAQVGELYRYDVDAFDPEHAALAFSFASPAPPGMTIDPASGVISWTPGAPPAPRDVVVRATDAGGAFEDQGYRLTVTQDPLVLGAPEGEYTVAVGDTLELRFQSNYPGTQFQARPMPGNATLAGDLFRFTPRPGQAGDYDMIFKGFLSGLFDSNAVRIRVVDPNLPPVFGALGPFEVAEGGSLRIPVAATDPDGDALVITAPGLALENAVFDEFANALLFQPSYEQAGSYDVVLRASDGVAVVETHVAITVTDAVAPVGDLDLVVNPPQSPTFVRGQTISGSVVGEVASVQTPAAALVTGLAPTNAQQGRTATVAITGRNTQFVQGETTATFGEGISVDSFTVTSPTQASANLSVSPTAPVGIRQMRVRSGGQEIPSVVAFRVEAGAAVVRGVLRDEFTGQPIVGVRVTVNGTSASAITGADGSFEIVGVPGGAQTLVAVAPNFEVLEMPLAVEENSTYALAEPIGLRALARPAQPGGSLPRAQTLASVLDRGVSSLDQPITHEQARLLILDTIVAAGVDQLGAIDDSGAQLNPRVTGGGLLSLKPAAVDFFADRLTRGETFTLGQIASMLHGALGWALTGLDPQSFLYMLQANANAAWANAGNPDYALAIVVFSPDATTLATSPPTLTADTRINSFQAFLLVSSVLARNFGILDLAFDQKLQELGIDPRDLLQDAGLAPSVAALMPNERPGGGAVSQIASHASSWLGMAGDFAFGPPAHAQGSPPPAPQPAFGGVRGGVANVVNAGWSTYIVSGGLSVVFGAAVVGLMAVCGVVGPLAAFSLLATLFIGVVSTLIAKFVGGFFQDTNLPINYAPKPPAVISQVDPTVDDPNFYLRFRRSASDIRADQLRRTNTEATGWLENVWEYQNGLIDERFLEHRYVLWKFPCNPDAPDCAGNGSTRGKEPIARESFLAPLSAGEIASEPFLPEPRSDIPDRKKAHGGEFEQFRVLKTRLTDGSNYFKVQTLQFYRRIFTGVNPDDPEIQIPWTDLGVEVPPPAAPSGPTDLVSGADALKGNAMQELGNLTGIKRSFQAERDLAAVEQARTNARAAMQREIEDRSAALLKVTGLGNSQSAIERAERDFRESLLDLDRQTLSMRTQVRRHMDVVKAIYDKFDQPGTLRMTANEIADQMLDPSTASGRRLLEDVNTPAARDLFLQRVNADLGAYRIQNALNNHNDALVQLQSLRQDLAQRRLTAPQTPEFPPIEINSRRFEVPGRTNIDGAVVQRTPQPREAVAITGPIDTQAAFDDAIDRLDAEIEFQRSQVRRLQTFASDPSSPFRVGQKARADALRSHYYDTTQLEENMSRLHAEKQKVIEAQRIGSLQKEAADAEMRADAMKNFRSTGVPGQRGFRGIQAAGALRKELIDQGATDFLRFKSGINPTAASNLVGVGLEVGNEVASLRSNIDLLASPLSDTIVVTARTLAPDPVTNRVRMEVTSAPAAAGEPAPDPQPGGASIELPAFPVADRFGAPAEPELPTFALGFAQGPLARLGRAPFVIDDAGRNPLDAYFSRSVKRVSFVGPGGAPIQFEPDPDLNEMLAFVYPAGPPADNPRDGFLFRDYPFSPPQAERYGAGFPSELIAVDSKGRVYLENYNSNEEFGGRVFRFAGDPVEREHVGSVNYFSQSLMYAHPAFPVAMEIGDARDGNGELVEDLFIANKDLGIYFDASRPAVHRVLRLMIHQLDTVPAYANGQNRNRLVAQPWAEHPDFRFDGATDLEVDGREAADFADAARPLYLSDGDSLYVLRDADRNGTAEVAKIAQVSGRTFSGIASDRLGNLYVADYAHGEVYLIPQQLLDDIVAGAQPPFASDDDLDGRAFLIKVDLDRPGDVELDSLQHRYIVSTPDGLEPFDIPLVGRLPANVAELRVDALGIELPVTLRGSRGNSFMMGANSEGTFAGKDVRFRVRRIDPGTGTSRWDAEIVRTQLLGATVLRDDALVESE